ncbi:MAG: DUF4215 domain-containing protein [Polyangiaceae bacterium]|nr:DUF4215 domain-containing protein [Polyangiaceae bacterium]
MKNWTRWGKDLSGVTLLVLAGLMAPGCTAGVAVDDEESAEADHDDDIDDEIADDTDGRFVSSDGSIELGNEAFELDPPSAPANDTCESAANVASIVGESVTVTGTLLLATDDYDTWCLDPSTFETGYRDVVYQLDIESECSGILTLSGDAAFTGALSLRSEACTTDDVCTNAIESTELYTTLHAGTYWAVVSATDTSSDDFSLTLQCMAPSCGDGFLNSTEDCDDGNTVSGDGCNDSCEFEAAADALDTCSGAAGGTPIEIGSGQILHLPGNAAMASTVGATDSGTGTCMLQPDDIIVAAPDHVRRVRPTADGTMKITIGLDYDDVPLCGEDPNLEPSFPYASGCYDRALHVRTGCESVATEVGCSDSWERWWAPEEVTFAVTANTDYYVFVDGYHDDEYGAGPYVMRIEMSP